MCSHPLTVAVVDGVCAWRGRPTIRENGDSEEMIRNVGTGTG